MLQLRPKAAKLKKKKKMNVKKDWNSESQIHT